MQTGERHDFASDNTAGICPEAWAALEESNQGTAASYGDDVWTARVSDRIRELFETDAEVFLVFSGTAANALALAQICRPFHSVLCHRHAHLETDECGAPEFFSGGCKLLPIGGGAGKLDLAEAESIVAEQKEHGVHAPKPRVVSLTQATELGTVYTRAELEQAAEFARRHQILLHMDGARFANAIATLGCRPREITADLGVDVLCFGGTKNGLGGGELVVFFNKELAAEFDYRAKQAGQLGSKLRFLAAPWLALLENDLWLRNARQANESARFLAEQLCDVTGGRAAFPVEANAVFLPLPENLVQALRARGWFFYKFIEPDIYRLMCSWATARETIEKLIADARDIGPDKVQRLRRSQDVV